MRKLMLLSVALIVAACSGTAASPSATSAPAPSTGGGASAPASAPAGPALSGEVKVLIHQNPPLVTFMESFNKEFEAAHPGVKVKMSVVNAAELTTSVQTRLTAADVDIVVPTLTGFSNAAQPYMKNVNIPAWQQLIDAKLLLDITDQPFVKNYDATAIKDATTYKDKVYGVPLGRVSYGGIYYNKDLFTANSVNMPTTWGELEAACATFATKDIPCMTAGGKDGWPVFVGAYGLAGSNKPDQAALVESLWNGSVKWTDAGLADLWKKYQTYDGSMLEKGSSGIAPDAAPGRFASGKVAMYPGGSWNAAGLEAAKPAFQWGYFPFTGSDTAADNANLFGKYDMVYSVAGNAPNKDAALAWLSDFSAAKTYQGFVDAVQFIPTQSGATLNAQIGKEIAPYLANFKIGFEQYWVAPKGAGEFAGGMILANMFKPFGTFDDPTGAAAKAQSDLDKGLTAQ